MARLVYKIRGRDQVSDEWDQVSDEWLLRCLLWHVADHICGILLLMLVAIVGVLGIKADQSRRFSRLKYYITF